MIQLTGLQYWRLPVELRRLNQWCLAGPDRAPLLVGDTGLYNASPVHGPWMAFEDAIQYGALYNMGIGFVLTDSDPFSCIDLDVKDVESRDNKNQPYAPELLTPPNQLHYYAGLVQFAASYTELSTSKKGLHIWVKGDIGSGKRKGGVEVYSRERFIVCTGIPISTVLYDIINGSVIPRFVKAHQLPVEDGSLLLKNLAAELHSADNKAELEEVAPDLEDAEIWRRASQATNAEKFVELCRGRWEQFGFPSQSEADLALMSMFTFYSRSNEQCRRMFRQTYLGQRSKAVKNDVYLDRTLSIIRGRQQSETERQAQLEQVTRNLMANSSISHHNEPLQNHPSVRHLVATMDQTQFSQAPDNEVNYNPPEVEGLDWPPGFTGAIAGFIYQSAPRPVKEVAIVAALGLMAGITGKAFNVGQTGLNLYIILVARSAIGKEAMHSGIGHILRSPAGHVVSPFVNFTDYASGPALVKGMEGFPSFVNVCGEWGRKLQRMADDKRDGPMSQLRTVMTNIYQKSGAASVVGGITYSNKEQNVGSTNAIAYSMIGETTPGTFYDSLTHTMMEDGFLSRFNIIEYHGERPPENENQLMEVPNDISNTLASIASHCSTVAVGSSVIQVKFDPDAERMFKDFNQRCDEEIRNVGPKEDLRQIWNRAHLKALRVAGVLACSDNHVNPCISANHADWAINLVLKDAYSMRSKVLGGDVGVDDSARFLKFKTILTEFLQGKVPPSYKLNPQMVRDGIVPRKYLQGKTVQIRSFQNYRLGATMALDHIIKTALDSGYISEFPRDKAAENYNYHGRCFRILEIEG